MLVRCKLGHTQQPMGGQVYSFDRDQAGRYVANVFDERHAACFIGAGTYEEVDPLPEGWQPGMPLPGAKSAAPVAPAKSQLLSGTALMMQMTAAGSFEFFVHEGKAYAASPWPSSVTMPDADIAEATGVLAINANGALVATVANGAATYDLLGKIDNTGLYSLGGGSTFETPPEVDEEDEDEDEEVDLDLSQGGQGTGTPPGDADKPKTLLDVVGIGRGMVKALEKAGIDSLEKLLALTPEQRAALDTQLKNAPTKGQWFEQAAELVKPKS